MAINLDNYFGVHARALMLREQRASQLANNLTNANTPNYKARDINFNETLKQAMSSSSQQMTTDSPGHIAGTGDFSSQLQYRVPKHMSLDGNTVDKEIETTEFARNALSYQASLSFLDGKIRSMMAALKGE
ncbi:flagellar basal body rod protein FlgB [Legionella spiritensis]|uniref:Flagellar basal body rod protein FlgB n=1 Tax=Legionella spiritensis TaxID=452 RepID=A0A0W0Z3Z0_LEGSP|nr:flagellar basal body rod protein FlgB [Legionella spiritensis]KTD63863.1 flagellar basal-body rod protein FlgB [Legionella spiritensis]SNV35528.1 flagellar basal-body rod protein FlgB [Legionella spiritensis]VEG89762.1 flagellar basal-body rod protein FlgB [Legionella spiritensis]